MNHLTMTLRTIRRAGTLLAGYIGQLFVVAITKLGYFPFFNQYMKNS